MGTGACVMVGLVAVFIVGLVLSAIYWGVRASDEATEERRKARSERDKQEAERLTIEAAARKQRAIDGFVKPEAPTRKGKSVTFTCGSGCQIDYFDDGKHTGTTHSRLTPEEVQALIKKAFGEEK